MGAILRSGFESGDIGAEGWETHTTGTLPTAETSTSLITPRKDINGLGGSYFLTNTTSTSSAYDCIKTFSRGAREGFLKFGINLTTTGLIFNANFVLWDGGDESFLVQFVNGSTYLVVRRGTISTILNTSSSLLSADSQWHVVLMHYYIDNTDGIVQFYKDYDFTTSMGSFSGDTEDLSTAQFPDKISIDVVGSSGANTRMAFDDIAINDITMTYSSGSGTIPAVGDTILGQTSGARATITAVLSGSTASAGTLQLCRVKDSGLTDWTGVQADDPFSSETIDDSLSSNLWSATITGLDKNSGFPSNGYIVGLAPNGDVAGKIQLSNTGGGSNYQDVDDIPPDEANYVSTSTSGNRDVYEVENISAAGLSSGDIGSIVTVMVSAHWQKSDATLNTGKIIIEHSSTEYESDALSPALGAFEGDTVIYDKIPDGTPTTSTDWTATNVDSLRVGVKFET